MGDLSRLILALILTVPILVLVQAAGTPEIYASEIENKVLRGEAVDYNGFAIQGDLGLSELSVLYPIKITNSTIDGNVAFPKTIFQQPVNLEGTAILGMANFWDSQFEDNASFQRCRFSGPADFRHAQFNGSADFTNARFNGTEFANAQFNGAADFSDARFKYAAFTRSKFHGRADFNDAYFNESADFYGSEFAEDANFAATKFNGSVYFSRAKFNGTVSIEEAMFRYPDDPLGARMLYNLAGQTLQGEMAIDHSISYPKVRISLFIDTPCAKTGALKAEDFGVQEEGKNMSIERFYLTGNASGERLDLAVVFDRSRSMIEEISVLQSRMQGLIDQINRSGMDGRYSLVTFADDLAVGSGWTPDSKAFQSAVAAIVPKSGGDEPEVALDAIESASLGFRPEARKVMLVVTDAPAHQRGDGTYYSNWTQEEVKDDLVASGVQLVVVSPVIKKRVSHVDLRDLANNSQGMWLDIGSANFSVILDKFTSIITETYVIDYGKVDWDEFRPEVTVTVNRPGCATGSITRSYRSKLHPELLPYEGMNISELNQSEREAYRRIFDEIYHPWSASLQVDTNSSDIDTLSDIIFLDDIDFVLSMEARKRSQPLIESPRMLSSG